MLADLIAVSCETDSLFGHLFQFQQDPFDFIDSSRGHELMDIEIDKQMLMPEKAIVTSCEMNPLAVV
jgi:hypothetical protein